MIKSLITGIMMLVAGVAVIFGARFGAAMLLEKLMNSAGPTATLIVLASGLFIFFAFFAARFFGWFHNHPRENALRKTRTQSLAQFSLLMAGLGVCSVILGSSEAMLSLAGQINEYVFGLIFIIFIFVLFFSAFRQDRFERRSRNQANWWRG